MREVGWWRYGCAAALAALTVSGGVVGGASEAEAAFPGTNGKIVFMSDRSGPDYDIFSMNSDGSGVTDLTGNSVFDWYPDVSADGTKIAFSSDADGDYEIFSMNTDGTGRTQLTHNTAFDAQPAWSPDGTKIAFSRGGNQLFTMNADGSGEQLVEPGPNAETPEWSPDGTKIVFEANRNGDNVDIFIVNANGGGSNRLTTRTERDLLPDWSPDGSKIAFVGDVCNPFCYSQIWVMNADGSGQTALTATSPQINEWPAWSPDGSKIVFSRSNAAGSWDIHVMNADGSGQTLLTTGGTFNLHADWGPAPPSGPPPGFVTRDGSILKLDGQPYRPVGLNIYNANSNGWCWYSMGGSILDESLTAIGAGKNAMRAWFFQQLATTNGIRDWSAFDHTLAVARAHGYKVVATLIDQWGNCGATNGQGYGYKTPAWYQDGYKQPDPSATVSYRDWVQEVAARYKNDPTILAWQLVNEPEVLVPNADGTGCNEAAAEPILSAFASDVAGLIKANDPNHLISLGTIGSGQCGAQYTDYKQVMSIPTLDLCEYHDYEYQHPMPGDQWNGLQFRINQCNELDKPLLVGELGVKPIDVGGTLADRASVVASKLCAQLSAGVAGELLWAWSKDGSTLDNFDIGPGDPVLDVLAPWSDPGHSCTVPDTTPPTIDCASPDGGWHATDASLACSALDDGSGLADPADASFVLSTSVPAGTETADAVTGSRQVCDKAGNCAVAGSIGGNMVDKKAPTIAIAAPAPASYVFNQPVAASYSCTDGGSGPAPSGGCAASVAGVPVASGANIPTSRPGLQTFTVTARDAVGNAATPASVTYRVVYRFAGFFGPVANPPTLNVVFAGRGVPIRFQLLDYTGRSVFPQQGLSVLAGSPKSAAIACSPTARRNTITQSTSSFGLRYNATANQYEFGWSTTGFAPGSCRGLTFKFNDGVTSRYLDFLFR